MNTLMLRLASVQHAAIKVKQLQLLMETLLRSLKVVRHMYITNIICHNNIGFITHKRNNTL